MGYNTAGFYHRLSPNTIRLLRLHPNTSNTDVGSLATVTLETAPPYYALSHCWGQQTKDVTIYVDGRPFPLSASLKAGIQRLRRAAPYIHPSVEYVWVDTLCINQQDIPERSSQVNLMNKIYSQSIRTIIWLGSPSVSSLTAWQFIDQIYNIFRSEYPLATDIDEIPTRMYSELLHSSSGLPSWEDELWACLRNLMELRWFSRIWVVQEVVLSPQDPVILHGEHSYSWDRLGWVATWLRRNGFMRPSQIPEEMRNVEMMCNLRRSRSIWPLDALISITQVKFHATDQRDKIYGLLGLAAESRDPSSLPDSLRPDYSIPVAEVYLKIARYLLNQGSSLALLTRARGVDGSLTGKQRQHRLDLPTWTPDWSDFRVFNRDIRTSLAWVDYADTSRPAQLGFPDHYSAAAGLDCRLHPSINPSTLRVNGTRVDCVQLAITFATKDFGKQLDWDHLISRTVRLLKLLMSTKIADDTLEWVIHFIKVTTVDQYRLGGRDSTESVRDGLAFIYEVISETQNGPNAGFSSRNKDFLDRLRQHSIGGTPKEYAALAVNYCFDRSFLVTSSGRMAIGPSETQVGDTIAVLPGSGVPYIIRQRGSSWALVGESYVQGLMRGEAIERLQEGTAKEEILDFE